LANHLKPKGWLVFKAGSSNLMAGQRYIGDLEKNLQLVIQGLMTKKKNLWIVPRFQEMYYGGRHEFSPVSILDQILPAVENGDIRIIGEIDSVNLEKIIQYRPEVLNNFEIIRLGSSSQEFTIDLAHEWIKKEKEQEIWKHLDREDLKEIYFLANQYLSHSENPGGLMELIKQTKQNFKSTRKLNAKIELHDFVNSLSSISGLPTNILDDREKLDLEDLKEHFYKKVIGQDDAVNTIVERIAMIKAGLTDPSKPSGVFLFVGPTGTGKTEIAKALAEYLFGTADRLIRLDMSEYQTPDSTFKIFGAATDIAESAALVNSIRKNPFSVVLLDEFEKAHPNIWDLFLQVFDDGRLTDQRGAIADFRHCIIILTSNLGASMPSNKRIGFGTKHEYKEVDANIMKGIEQTFRPEFVNRLDKIVVFNPLTKSIAKQILKGELKNILKRRGLRRRQWELDMDESAIDFLLEKGFSTTLGARPLKRAIEKYLLAPLAITIVNHNFPKGDQFLLVSSGKNKLKVEFIDPDEPEYTWDQKKQIVEDQSAKLKDLSIKDVVLDARGTLSEFKLIASELKELNTLRSNLDLEFKKNQLLEHMSDPDFWNEAGRFEVLSEIEFLDRFESTLSNASNLFHRLEDPEKERLTYDPRLIKKIAEKLYLLSMAIDAYQNGVPQDCLLEIHYNEKDNAIAKRVVQMYTAWAKNRNMKLESVHKRTEAMECFEYFTIAGFGAYSILESESGYHLFERKDEKTNELIKQKVQVKVLPMEDKDYRRKDFTFAIQRFEKFGRLTNTRRYKFQKSPLIKDVKQNWQTGKVERVMNGDLDLFKS
jgi:ATP-dependent Clp protease ATP-binding subunit ClpC